MRIGHHLKHAARHAYHPFHTRAGYIKHGDIIQLRNAFNAGPGSAGFVTDKGTLRAGVEGVFN